MRWSIISDKEFEVLCYKLISNEGFENPTWYGGGGGDKGRDIVAYYSAKIGNIIERFKYLIQCKRILSKGLSVSDISGLKDWLDAQYFDYALIITTTHVTADTLDWIESINKETSYKLLVWDRAELEKMLSINFLY